MTSFDRSIDRRLVHRSSIAAVFLTSISERHDGTWVFGVQIPRFPGTSGRHPSPVPISSGAEVLRQCGLALAHTGLGVPIGHAFAIETLGFAWDQPQVFPEFGPFEAQATMVVLERITRREETTGLHMEWTMCVQSGQVATGGGVLRCVPPTLYRRLRRQAATEIVIRHDRKLIRKVRQEDSRVEGLLGWNHADPIMFDHQTDHLPGMQIMTSMVRAAEAVSGGTALGVQMKFHRFTEFRPAPGFTGEMTDDHTFRFAVEQSGFVTTTGSVHVS